MKRRTNATRKEPVQKRRLALTRLVQPARMLLLAALSVTGLYGAIWVFDPWNFPIQYIEVDGDLVHVDRTRLMTSVREYTRHGFFGVDVDAVRREALRLPWVADVSVMRRWPDRLLLSIVERQAVARWGDGALVDAAGAVFSVPGAPPPGLPGLLGPPDSAKRLLAWHADIARRYAGALDAPTRMELDARGVLRVTFGEQPELTLRTTDIEASLARFAALWGGLTGERRHDMLTADLRYQNGFAVKWRPAADPAADLSRRGEDA